jgi:hypothetical protein
VQVYRYFVSQSSKFVAITLFVTSQLVFVVVSVYFVIHSVRKLLDTLMYFQQVHSDLSITLYLFWNSSGSAVESREKPQSICTDFRPDSSQIYLENEARYWSLLYGAHLSAFYKALMNSLMNKVLPFRLTETGSISVINRQKNVWLWWFILR